MTDDQRATRLRARMAARHADDEPYDDDEPGPPWHAQLARYVMHAALLAVLASGAWALSQRPSAPPAPLAAPTAAIVEAPPRAMPSVGSQEAPGAPEAQPTPQSTPLPTALVWTIPAEGVLVQPDGSVVGAKPDRAPPGTAVPAVIAVQAAPAVEKLPAVGKAEPTAVKLPRGGKETRP